MKYRGDTVPDTGKSPSKSKRQLNPFYGLAAFDVVIADCASIYYKGHKHSRRIYITN
jgi:hypothetical protein